jgi:DNA polymerase-3 subunit gamma/tau
MYVAQEEGKTLGEDAALLIARHGKGSYRDALGVLEQVLTTGGKSIKLDDVMASIGTPDALLLLELLKSFCVSNESAIAKSVGELQKKHTSALKTYDELLDMVRRALLIRVGALESKDTELTQLSKEYATMLNSKLILALIEERHLLEVSETHAWTAFLAIMLSVGK